MFLIKINAIKDNLTANEKKIVEYLVNNSNDSKVMTSTQIAEKINVSQPSVIRLSKKLGYSSFREMIVDLPNETDELEDQRLHDSESDEETLLEDAKTLSQFINSNPTPQPLKSVEDKNVNDEDMAYRQLLNQIQGE